MEPAPVVVVVVVAAVLETVEVVLNNNKGPLEFPEFHDFGGTLSRAFWKRAACELLLKIRRKYDSKSVSSSRCVLPTPSHAPHCRRKLCDRGLASLFLP